MYCCRCVASAVFGALVVGMASAALAEDNAVIKGKVIFKGAPAKYKRKVIDTAKDPNCKKTRKRIGSENVVLNGIKAHTKDATVPITVRNVMVYVKEGLGGRKFPAKTEPLVLNQVGCQYKPHVIAIMAGQPLRVRNSDPTNHNIHFLPKVNQEMNFSQPKQDMKKDVKLVVEDVFKVKCDVHPWMGCFIRVFDHPFFNVTEKDGTFTLDGLPPGKYVIEAWHEKFGTQTMTVEVASGETKEADFTYEPDK